MTKLPLPLDAGEPSPGRASSTVAEAAEQLQVCERTVRRAIRRRGAARCPRPRHEARARLVAAATTPRAGSAPTETLEDLLARLRRVPAEAAAAGGCPHRRGTRGAQSAARA